MPQTATSLAGGEFLELDDDLLDQLAGRRQDDRLGAPAAGFEHLDQGNAEGGRLAGARLGLADDVEAVEGLGDQGRLDRGGRLVADLLEGPEHRGAQAHGREPGSGLLLNASNQTILRNAIVVKFHLADQRLRCGPTQAWGGSESLTSHGIHHRLAAGARIAPWENRRASAIRSAWPGAGRVGLPGPRPGACRVPPA